MNHILLWTYLTCNQAIYDRLYKAITQNALEAPLNPEVMEERNNAIELLRKLCNNQKSTYERTK
jgi:hypothetical protein